MSLRDSKEPEYPVPQETLHEIVTLSILEHIHDLLTGTLALPCNLPSAEHPRVTANAITAFLDRLDERNDILNAPNPTLALMRSSHRLRVTALKVVARALGIEVSYEGGFSKYVPLPFVVMVGRLIVRGPGFP